MNTLFTASSQKTRGFQSDCAYKLEMSLSLAHFTITERTKNFQGANILSYLSYQSKFFCLNKLVGF